MLSPEVSFFISDCSNMADKVPFSSSTFVPTSTLPSNLSLSILLLKPSNPIYMFESFETTFGTIFIAFNRAKTQNFSNWEIIFSLFEKNTTSSTQWADFYLSFCKNTPKELFQFINNKNYRKIDSRSYYQYRESPSKS